MAKLYFGEFSNSQVQYSDNSDLSQNVIVRIIDILDPSNDEVDIELADNPVSFRIVDNSEDKFTTIRSKACEIRVFTNPNFNIMTFGTGGDNQYQVEICMNISDNVIFKGWLSVSDLRQDFQPDPNVLVLTATDGLGFLKDIPLTDFNGDRFTGMHRISEYIAGCLAKTGTPDFLIAEMNIKESTQQTDFNGHFFYTMYLDARTFESSLGEFEDCFTVLEKILGEYCELSQQKGAWYIKAIDEFDAQPSKQIRFTQLGVVDYELAPAIYQKSIGSDMTLYTMGFMNDDAQISLQRPYKFITHEYRFEPPQELPCNVNFERGEFVGNLPDETIDGITYTAKKYQLDCWDLLRGAPSIFNQFPTSDLYIKRLFDQYGREETRYTVVKWPTAGVQATVVKSTGIQVQKDDKFDMSWDFAFSQDLNIGSGNLFVASILLEGNDGTYWFLDDTSGTATNTFTFPFSNTATMKWYQSNASWSVNYKLLQINLNTNASDDREFRTISIDRVEPIPVTGNLFIIFHWANDATFSGIDLHLSNLQFNYRGLINGTYDEYTGTENKVEQPGDYKASRDEQVYISDGPKLSFKGCLQKRVGDYLIMGGAQATITFYNANYFTLPGYWTWLFPDGLPLLISGTSLNNSNDVFVVSTAYSIVGNVTTVVLSRQTFAEVDSNYAISTIRFGLTEGFYNAAVFPDGPPDPSYVKPFAEIRAQAVWNQFNRVFTAFEGTIDGLDTNEVDALGRYDLPDLMHSYLIMDAHPGTENKTFKLLHMDQNLDLCEWGFYMMEVYDSTIPKVYTGHSFKYIQND